jgi:hypothetical protein
LADVKVDEKPVFAQKTAEALLFRLAQGGELVAVAAELKCKVALALHKGWMVATRVVEEAEAAVCSQVESMFVAAALRSGQIFGGPRSQYEAG